MGKRVFKFVLLALAAMAAVLFVATPTVGYLFGAEAADNFLANGATAFGMLVLATTLALAVCGTFRLAAWLIGKVARRG